jgi:hypothetical protein
VQVTYASARETGYTTGEFRTGPVMYASTGHAERFVTGGAVGTVGYTSGYTGAQGYTTTGYTTGATSGYSTNTGYTTSHVSKHNKIFSRFQT